MKSKTVILITIIGLFVSACEKIIDDVIKVEQTDLLVVEGIITNEKINHRIKLSHPHTTQNEDSQPATGAIVAIVSTSEEINLLHEFPKGSGEYYTDSMRAVFGKGYVLYIMYKGKEYNALDFSSPGQPLEPLRYSEVDLGNQKRYSLAFEKSGTTPNYITYDINWESTTYCDANSNDCYGKLIYYDLKNIDIQEIYAPTKEVFLFPAGSRIVRKKYSVSNNYKEFLRSLLSETEWRGGLFDVEHANIPTNLSEGAIGFFAVSTVFTDTIVINE